jgi:peptidoglycan/xylan/chitin deacetylase (PgdA/CDA1 family)
LRPNDKETGSVLITFDDGYEDIYDNAYPILQKFGFTGAIFLVTDYIGKHNLWDVNVGMKRFKHMGWDKIREMQRANFVFGSHTVTHPDLTKLNRKEIKKELEISKKAIEDKLGQEVKFLSYPFGKQNETVRRIAEEIGYKACFTSNPFSIDRFAIGRMGIYIIDTMSEFAIKSEGREDFFYTLEGVKGNIINYFSKGTAIWKNRCQVIGVRHLKRLRLSFKGCATRLGGCLPWDDERNEQRPRSTNDEHLKPNT